eukprot:7766103-Lingulodinium_polyedra.AAC.1
MLEVVECAQCGERCASAVSARKRAARAHGFRSAASAAIGRAVPGVFATFRHEAAGFAARL